MRPSPRHLAASMAAVVALASAPSLVLAGPSEDLQAEANKVFAEFEKCIKRAGSNASKVRKCEATANKKLSALEKKARGLASDDGGASRALVQKRKRQVASQARGAGSAPKEAAKLAESDDMLAMDESAAEPAPRAAPVKRSRHRYKRKKSRSRKGSMRAYGAAARPPRPKPRPTITRDTTSAEDYKNYGVNKMTETSEDNLSTFAVDVDTGSYVITRRKLNAGTLPPAASVRVEEFVNYFRYDYPQPKSGPFAVALEAAPSPFTAEKNRYLLRVGVQGKKLTAKQRKPVHLTFLVDVSGSMNRHDKLGLAKNALKIMTNNLRQGDTVALVTYASGTRVVLEPTGMYERGKILEALDDLRAGGGTAMGSGMDLAYKQALKNFKRSHVNRVIVLSDGDTNIGPRNQEELHREIKKYVDEGVTLSMIGFGMGNYKDTMMEQLANKGNGNYYYIDTEEEARKVFGEQLDGTLQVIAKDVKIQVEFDKKAVKKYRLIGYENRDIADKDFRNDRVDAGEIGAGHTVTALYEVELAGSEPARKLGTVRIRHKKPDGYKATEASFVFRRGDVHDKLSSASKDFQFAAAVAGFAEILRGSPYAEGMSLALVEEVARGASSAKQKDRQEFLALVAKAKKLKK